MKPKRGGEQAVEAVERRNEKPKVNSELDRQLQRQRVKHRRGDNERRKDVEQNVIRRCHGVSGGWHDVTRRKGYGIPAGGNRGTPGMPSRNNLLGLKGPSENCQLWGPNPAEEGGRTPEKNPLSYFEPWGPY